MTKKQLKEITVTYTRTLTFTPTEDIFEVEPYQEAFESYALCELFDTIYEDVSRDGDPMPYTDIQQGETVEIDWGDEE
jgi:hypothetical protein